MKAKLTPGDVALHSLYRGGRRNALLLLGVFLSVWFLSVSTFGASCIWVSAQERQKNTYGEAEVIVPDIREADAETLVSEGVFSRYAVEELLYQSVGDPENWDDDFPIARNSPQRESMLRTRLIEGRMPAEPGEIAVEQSALVRLRMEANVGNGITLTLRCFDGEEMFAGTVEKRFTLVGILKNTGFALNSRYGFDSDSPLLTRVGEAVVSPEEPLVPGSRAVRTALGAFQGPGSPKALDNWWADSQPGREKESRVWRVNDRYSALFIGDEGSLMLVALITVFLALTMVSMAGVANALTASIDRRKAQIGMLRAIGATGSQVRALLLRETSVIAAVSIPPAVGLSLALLWAAHLLYPETVVFSVPVWMIAVDIAVCAGCVYLSSLAPVRRSSRISPMQAVRDVDIARNFLRKDEKSRQRFVPQRLLARRNNALRPGRTAGLTILVGVGAVLFSVAFMVCAWLLDTYGNRLVVKDYTLSNYGNSTSFLINEQFTSGRLTARDKAEIAGLPYVAGVSGTQIASVSLLMDTVTDYATGGGYFDRFGCLSPEPSAYSLEIARLMSAEEEQRTREIARADFDSYRRAMETLGWPGEALPIDIAGLSDDYWKSLSRYVLAGDIDLNALASGAEVLLIAPERYGILYDMEALEGGSVAASSEVLTGDRLAGKEAECTGGVYENDMFRAGDSLLLGFAWSRDSRVWGDGWTLPEDTQALTRSVRIGAILDVGAGTAFPGLWSDQNLAVITSEAGLAALGIDANYRNMGVRLRDDTDEETRAYLSERIRAVAGRSSGAYVFDHHEAAAADRRMSVIVTLSCAAILLLLCGFTWAILNSAVAGRIQSDVRQIGTMRAVGASKRVIFRSYAQQLYRIFWIGGGIGWTASALLILLPGLLYENPADDPRFAGCFIAPAYLLPLLGLCLMGVRLKLRPIFRKSVVENIRAL